MDAGSLLRSRGLSDQSDLTRALRVKEICAMLDFACNIRCPLCPFWGTTGVSHGGRDSVWHAEFRPESLRRFLDGMRAFGGNRLNVSGGEPLANRRWIEVSTIAREPGYRIMLTTNASFLERELENVKQLVDVIQISFTDPAEWRRGFKREAWSSELGRMLSSLKEHGVEIQMNIAISDAGFPEIEAVTDAVLGSMPVNMFRFVHPMFLAPDVLAAHQADLAEFGTRAEFWRGFGTVPVRVDPEALSALLARLAERYPGRTGVFPELDAEDVAPFYRDPWYLPARFRDFCAAPWTQVNLIPNGDVWVCYDVKLGNIHEDDAEAIWNGERAKALRRRILERGLFAGCRGCFNKYSAIERGTARRGGRP